MTKLSTTTNPWRFENDIRNYGRFQRSFIIDIDSTIWCPQLWKFWWILSLSMTLLLISHHLYPRLEFCHSKLEFLTDFFEIFLHFLPCNKQCYAKRKWCNQHNNYTDDQNIKMIVDNIIDQNNLTSSDLFNFLDFSFWFTFNHFLRNRHIWWNDIS